MNMATVRYAGSGLCEALKDSTGRNEQVRDLSEVESELGNLNNIIDDSFKLIYELKDRLGCILKTPRPENTNGINGRTPPDSNIGNSIREQSYKVQQINDDVRELIERLAV